MKKYEIFFSAEQQQNLPEFLKDSPVETGVTDLFVSHDLDGEGEYEEVENLVSEELLGGIRPGKPQPTAD